MLTCKGINTFYGPAHVLFGGVEIASDVLAITVGYQRQWLSVGTIESIVISGGL